MKANCVKVTVKLEDRCILDSASETGSFVSSNSLYGYYFEIDNGLVQGSSEPNEFNTPKSTMVLWSHWPLTYRVNECYDLILDGATHYYTPEMNSTPIERLSYAARDRK